MLWSTNVDYYRVDRYKSPSNRLFFTCFLKFNNFEPMHSTQKNVLTKDFVHQSKICQDQNGLASWQQPSEGAQSLKTCPRTLAGSLQFPLVSSLFNLMNPTGTNLDGHWRLNRSHCRWQRDGWPESEIWWRQHTPLPTGIDTPDHHPEGKPWTRS